VNLAQGAESTGRIPSGKRFSRGGSRHRKRWANFTRPRSRSGGPSSRRRTSSRS